ncbi:nitroreductase family protein [Aestuariirhabdus sp. Z084]|uniref:nitroreductase family protein n=1 Tax=Aestuariirhabdus haliotis TaxID=2918751 RepID=UPI00201B4338|nr:nitroreductase family protein [Aestuariirhabdus haliotis]MCL6415274.1 nitroreductase family protein [Aestuariirhabdus haliotis]MCL6419534.1 nitroreductase family protein [Aestuariirhabdus haliotis]
MELFTAIATRRAVKHYDADAVMPDADFRQLMAATLLSPTSYNIQHWRFVRVTDRTQRKQLQDAAWGQEQVSRASELIVLCADTQAWQDRPERYWADAPQAAQEMLVPMLKDFYRGREQVQRDEAMRSCGMAAQTLMLAAKALGYDSCPMIGFDADAVAERINLPEQHVIGMMIAVGKAAKPANGRGGQLTLDEVLMENRF